MSFSPTNAPGATPLDPDEAADLIPSHISTQGELNDAEQANIRDARIWYLARSKNFKLSEATIRETHRRMFNQVWRWAGRYRGSNKNIGAEKHLIVEKVQALCLDVGAWIEHKTFIWDEMGVRLHHRLVAIHPFANGNGRHSRLVADLFMAANEQPAFSWGRRTFTNDLDAGQTSQLRDEYLGALRAADQGDISRLLKFVRS